MEKNISLEIPYLESIDAKQISALGLAYIGDAVYEIFVRSYVLSKGNTAVNKLHKASVGFVSAKAQSRIVHALEDSLTEEEIAVFKRGRNAHSNTSAKNADIVDYRHATGFEALIGYLFICGKHQRIEQLISLAFEFISNENK